LKVRYIFAFVFPFVIFSRNSEAMKGVETKGWASNWLDTSLAPLVCRIDNGKVLVLYLDRPLLGVDRAQFWVGGSDTAT
jgi:hypothetical protein